MRVDKLFYLNPKSNVSKYTDFINYIDTSSVNHGRLDNVTLLTEDFPSRAQRKVLQGDILYSSVRPNLRHYHLYSSSFDHVVASTGFVLLRKKIEDTNEKFAYYFLSTNSVVDYLTNIAELSQATFPSFSPKDIGRIELPNFTLTAQRKIAGILSAYDLLIDNNNKRIKILEQMAQNLYREWFVRFRFPGHENSEFVDGLPKGWEYVRLGNYANIVMGQSPESKYYNDNKKGLPFHQGVGSYGDIFLVDDIFSTEGKKLADPLSIIFSVRAPVGRININLTKIILGRGVAAINANSGSNTFLHWALKSKFMVEDTIGNGSIFTSVTKNELEKQVLIIPSNDILLSFEKVIKQIELSIRAIYRQNTILARQRDALLPRLMSGKLAVKTEI